MSSSSSSCEEDEEIDNLLTEEQKEKEAQLSKKNQRIFQADESSESSPVKPVTQAERYANDLREAIQKQLESNIPPRQKRNRTDIQF